MFNFKQIPDYFSWFFKPFKGIFSIPQLENFKRFVTGLVISDKKNIQEINAVYGDKDQSSLNRFVTESKWSFDEVDDLRLGLAVKKLGSKPSGFILLDDTMARKTGKKMEKANYHRSGVTKQKEWGHCFVDSLYVELDSGVRYPIKINPYIREVDTDEQNPFKTKRELALEQIDFALKQGVKAKTVIADAWYYSDKLVQELKARHLKYFLGVRNTLKISIEGKKRISIVEYLANLKLIDFQTYEFENGIYYLHDKEVNIRGEGKSRLLVSYKKGDKKKIKCYVTNQFRWTSQKYMLTLLKRWGIETLHRDTKQHLGLEDYQVRKYGGMQAVALAVLVAYTLLILNALPSLLRKFRPLQTIGEMCRFAKLSAQKSGYWMKKKFNDLVEGRKILNQLVLVKNAKV